MRRCVTRSCKRRRSTRKSTDLNVLVGLCVGHDALFIKYSEAPVTTLVAKDRVLGHNPVAALYETHSYYRRLLNPVKETEKKP